MPSSTASRVEINKTTYKRLRASNYPAIEGRPPADFEVESKAAVAPSCVLLFLPRILAIRVARKRSLPLRIRVRTSAMTIVRCVRISTLPG